MAHFKKEEKEKHLIEYEVTVEEEKVRETMENIYKEASRRILVPGFRKGKAPRNILKAHVNQSFIQDELTRKLVPEALHQVLKEENVTLFGEPDIEVITINENQPLVFKALVLEKPQTHLANPEEIEIHKYQIVIRDSDVDKEIEGVRKSRGTWEEKEDIPIETGDMVKVRIGEKEYAIMAGLSEVDSKLSRVVIGMKKGETSQIQNIENQEGQPSEELSFSIVEVLRRKLPDVNEEFVKQINPDYKSVEDLRAKTRESLEKWANDLVDIRMEKEAVAAITKKSEVSIPSVLVDHETKHQIDHFVEHIKKDGFTLEKYMELTNTDFDTIEKDFKKHAQWELKKMFVLQEYAIQNAIKIDEEEMNAELEKIAQKAGKEVEDVRQILKRNDKLEDFRDQKLQQKLIHDLIQKVKIKEVKEPLNLDQWKTLEDPEEEMVE